MCTALTTSGQCVASLLPTIARITQVTTALTCKSNVAQKDVLFTIYRQTIKNIYLSPRVRQIVYILYNLYLLQYNLKYTWLKTAIQIETMHSQFCAMLLFDCPTYSSSSTGYHVKSNLHHGCVVNSFV